MKCVKYDPVRALTMSGRALRVQSSAGWLFSCLTRPVWASPPLPPVILAHLVHILSTTKSQTLFSTKTISHAGVLNKQREKKPTCVHKSNGYHCFRKLQDKRQKAQRDCWTVGLLQIISLQVLIKPWHSSEGNRNNYHRLHVKVKSLWKATDRFGLIHFHDQGPFRAWAVERRWCWGPHTKTKTKMQIQTLLLLARWS